MIEIVVVSRQGAPMTQALEARFGPEGGTIGRADTNTLVLDDPDRTVSRVHGQVLCRDGGFFIVDRGSNPLVHNGEPLGAGNEAPLAAGDRLVIGGFELSVRGATAAPVMDPPAAWRAQATAPTVAPARPLSDDDPFADLLAGLGPAVRPAAPAASAPVEQDSAFFPDPLGALPAQARDPVDPFAGLGGGGQRAGAASLEDFSDLGLPSAGQGARIDDLFGGSGGIGLGGDPLALSPLADPLLQPNTAGGADPLAAFGNLPAASQAARSDHLPIGQFGFQPPTARAAEGALPAVAPDRVLPESETTLEFDDQTGQPIRVARSPAAADPPRVHDGDAQALALPAAAVPESMRPEPSTGPAAFDPFADLLGPGAGADAALGAFDALAPAPAAPPAFVAAPAIVPPSVAPMPAPVPRQVPVAAPVAATVAGPAPVPVPALVPMAAAGVRGSDAAAELLAAFLRGLGPVHQTPTTLTPALMERIGSLLRSSTEGTLQLLLTRQELKREVRAEVTMIAAQANNPLKFSPTADVALSHLLGPGMRGFMPAEAAMKDAYDDLRAHQFGVMVGMRAALERLIARFGPEELEKKIAARSAIDSLFAANRKAKLWDQFTALYSTIAAEAEDDFHTLFGKAFLQAYEEQMARLKSNGSPTS